MRRSRATTGATATVITTSPVAAPIRRPTGTTAVTRTTAGALVSVRSSRTRPAPAPDTTQDATADDSTHQSNVNKPFAFLSSFGDHGCGCTGGGGGVSQSNDADTHAVAGNLNATQQWIGQYQSALIGKGVAA